MIAFVRGLLEEVEEQSVVIDCQGLGYRVNVSPATISRLPSRGSEVKLFTYLQAKEDGVSLHGFLTREEVRLFTLLISVSGIGPKVATAILATLNPSQIILAIVADDAAAFSKAPGVGKKTAQRISLELRDKIKSFGTRSDDDGWQPSTTEPASSSEKQEAMDALQALGYTRSESLKAVLETATEGMRTEAIIKLALKKLAR